MVILPVPPITMGLLKTITGPGFEFNVWPVGILAAPALKVPPVCVKPAVKTILAGVVTAVEIHAPFVFVTKPVKVVIPVLLLSVKLPPNVLFPPTAKLPVVLTVSEEELPSTRSLGIEILALPENVSPPAPTTVNVPAPVNITPPEKSIALVTSISLKTGLVDIVAVGTLNMPDVCVSPPLNIRLAVLRAEKSTVPVLEKPPLKVVALVLSVSVKVPDTLVDTPTLTVPVLENVSTPLTVREIGKLIFTAPPIVTAAGPAKVILPPPVTFIPFEKLIDELLVIVVLFD